MAINSMIEIDLREEMRTFLFGSSSEISKGQLIVLRRMRRDSDNKLIPCDCVDPKTHEPDRDCIYCDGEGWIFDEEFVTAYKTDKFNFIDREDFKPFSKITVPLSFFYVQHTVEPTRADKIIELEYDLEGKIIIPFKKRWKHNIEMAEAFRSDNGRVEFFRIGVRGETTGRAVLVRE